MSKDATASIQANGRLFGSSEGNREGGKRSMEKMSAAIKGTVENAQGRSDIRFAIREIVRNGRSVREEP